jgi:HlyD family secretion protein
MHTKWKCIMTQTSIFNKVMRWMRTLRYPMLIAVIAGIIWYVRSQPTLVNRHIVNTGPVVRSVMGTGTLEARIRTTVSPKISGRIAEVLVDQGSVVKAGELLVRLDGEDLEQQVRMAKAVISTSEATFGRFRAEIEQSKSIYAKTESDIVRTQKLIVANSVSQSELDQAREAFELAKSGLLKAEANLLEAEQQVALNRETLKFQEARLTDSLLIAPFDGLVIGRERDAGAIVVPGSPILQLISLDELWVSAWVDETEMDQLKAEQPAKIVFRSQPSTAFDGAVARLGKQSDRETREFIVDVRALKLPETWAIGQRAEVFIETARVDEVVWVPSSFLSKQGDESGVYIQDSTVAKWRPLKLGIEGRDTTEVREGLSSGEVVIKPAEPITKLRDGSRVLVP